jgi:hypothetical protein
MPRVRMALDVPYIEVPYIEVQAELDLFAAWLAKLTLQAQCSDRKPWGIRTVVANAEMPCGQLRSAATRRPVWRATRLHPAAMSPEDIQCR